MNLKQAKQIRRDLRVANKETGKLEHIYNDSGSGHEQYRNLKKAAKHARIMTPVSKYAGVAGVPSEGKASKFKGFRNDWRALETKFGDGSVQVIPALIADFSISEEKKERRASRLLQRRGR